MKQTQTHSDDFKSIYYDIKRDSPFIISIGETRMLGEKTPSSVHILCDMPDDTRHCYTLGRSSFDVLHLSGYDGKRYNIETYKNKTWCETNRYHKRIRTFLERLCETADYFKKDSYGYTAQWNK